MVFRNSFLRLYFMSSPPVNTSFPCLPLHGAEGLMACVPVQNDGATRGARAALIKRLRSEPVVKVGRWSRDELYED